MRHDCRLRVRRAAWVTASIFALGVATASAQSPQPAPDAKPSFEIYGFAMLDMGHDF